MEDHIREDILEVLRNAVRAIHREDSRALKELSNMTIHNASIHQDQYSITVSVLIYTLAKLFERQGYEQYKGWSNFPAMSLEKLQAAIHKVELRDDPGFDLVLKDFFKALQTIDKSLKLYIQDVLKKAKISKASRLHEHGISAGRTAELLGISRYELMEYVGRTYIADVRESITKTEKERMKFARGLFE